MCRAGFYRGRYNDASHDYIALRKIIGKVTDILLLGSEIYSQWKYYKDWAINGEDITSYESQMWFLTALGRLKALTALSTEIFRGTPTKISIVSKNTCYSSEPEPNDKVEQHLTINSVGGVWFSAYNFDEGKKTHILSEKRTFIIKAPACPHKTEMPPRNCYGFGVACAV